MFRKKICVANWKMNKNFIESNDFLKKISQKDLSSNSCELVICPSYDSLFLFNKFNFQFSLGAQDVSYLNSPSSTGEISVDMLTSHNCEYVIIGHSERRSLCQETSSIVSLKAVKAISAGLKVIICIGENSKDREKGDYLFVLEEQLKQSLFDLSSDNNLLSNNIIIAYEPVWAIGTGNTASKKDIEEVHKFIKEIINTNYQFNYDLPILYGGSVNSKNSSEIFKINNVDGVLVGGASLKSDEFLKIIKNSM